MIICRNCGAQNNDGSAYCYTCGSSLFSATQSAPAQGGSTYNNCYAPPNAAMSAQYAPASVTMKGCFSSAWEDVRSSQGWVGKSLLLGLISCVPILNFVVPGYAMRWGRKAMFGNRESMPKQIFADSSFATGFYWWALSLVFFAVVGLVGLALAFVPVVGWLAAIALFFFVYMFMSACGIRIALSGRLGAGFNFSVVWPAYKKSLGSLFCASVLPGLVIGLIAGVIVVIIVTAVSMVCGVGIVSLFTHPYYYSGSYYYYLPQQALFSAAAPYVIVLTTLFLAMTYLSSVVYSLAELVTWRAMGYWAARNAGEWLMDPSMTSAFSDAPANNYAHSIQGGYGSSACAPAPIPVGTEAIPERQQRGINSDAGQYSAGNMISSYASVQNESNTSYDAPRTAVSNNDRETTVLRQDGDDRETSVLGGGCAFVKLVRDNGTTLTVSDFPATIGKGSAASVQLTGNNAVSRVHARIIKSSNSFAIEDLNSTNGTRINDALLTGNEVVALHDGDVLSFGDEKITVRL